jgi:hypothetical protein
MPRPVGVDEAVGVDADDAVNVAAGASPLFNARAAADRGGGRPREARSVLAMAPRVVMREGDYPANRRR